DAVAVVVEAVAADLDGVGAEDRGVGVVAVAAGDGDPVLVDVVGVLRGNGHDAAVGLDVGLVGEAVAVVVLEVVGNLGNAGGDGVVMIVAVATGGRGLAVVAVLVELVAAEVDGELDALVGGDIVPGVEELE